MTPKDEEDTAENRRERRMVEQEDGARRMRPFVKRQAMTRRRGTRLDESDAKRCSTDAEVERVRRREEERKTEENRGRKRTYQGSLRA